MKFDKCDYMCQVCGETDLVECVEKDIRIAEFDGIECRVDEVVIKCFNCKSTGDFFDENDDVILTALDKFDIQCVNHIIERFEKFGTGFGFASLELLLGLDFGFFKSWKAGNIEKLPKETITLLKLIFTYPWLLITIDEGYRSEKADKILKFAADRKNTNEKRKTH